MGEGDVESEQRKEDDEAMPSLQERQLPANKRMESK